VNTGLSSAGRAHLSFRRKLGGTPLSPQPLVDEHQQLALFLRQHAGPVLRFPLVPCLGAEFDVQAQASFESYGVQSKNKIRVLIVFHKCLTGA
jgi:hypothetical protein